MTKKRENYLKKYPPNWLSEIVPAIKERAQNRCEHCGVQNGKIVWRYKKNGKTHWEGSFENAKSLGDAFPEKKIRVFLAVAHLDHDEDNFQVNFDRLAFLCQKCHLQHDVMDDVRRIKERDPENSKIRKIRNISTQYLKPRRVRYHRKKK